MRKRIVLGGIVGGLVLFAWSFIAHLPPIGTAGERALSPAQGDAILGAMRGSMRERAVYIIFRGMTGPTAIIAYDPQPAERMIAGSPFATFMAIELLFAIAAALLGSVVTATLSPTLRFWPRVFVLAAIGVLETIDVDGGYWNWYGFPSSYFLAQFVDHAGGWFFVGIVLARYFAIQPPPRQTSPS